MFADAAPHAAPDVDAAPHAASDAASDAASNHAVPHAATLAASHTVLWRRVRVGRRVVGVFGLHDWSLLELFGGRKVQQLGSGPHVYAVPRGEVRLSLLWTKFVDLFSVFPSTAHKLVKGRLAHSDSPPQVQHRQRSRALHGLPSRQAELGGPVLMWR